MTTNPAPPPLLAGAPIDELVAELHRAHALTLIRMANLLLRDRQSAEDVVQDTFLSLDRSGRYLLIDGAFQVHGKTAYAAGLDLATGRVIAVPGSPAYAAESIAW